MKKFLIRVLILSIPFLLYAMAVVIIDPFCFFGSTIIPEKIKSMELRKDKENMVLNVAAYRLNCLENSEASVYIVGDSRSQWLTNSYLEEALETNIYNCGIPGLDYREIAAVAKLCAEQDKCKEILWVSGFHNYLDAWGKGRDIIVEANSFRSKPLNYFVKKNSVVANYHIIKTYIKAIHKRKKYLFIQQIDSVVNGQKCHKYFSTLYEPFGDELISQNLIGDTILYQCDTAFIQRFSKDVEKNIQLLKGYSRPTELPLIIDDVGRLCQINNIEIGFIIFPNYLYYQKLIIDNNRLEDKKSFVNDLLKIGNVYYADMINEFSANIDLYNDLFHTSSDG